jgi:hypothetical protein
MSARYLIRLDQACLFTRLDGRGSASASRTHQLRGSQSRQQYAQDAIMEKWQSLLPVELRRIQN